MAKDQAPERQRGPRAFVCSAEWLAWLHGSLLVSLVLAAAILTARSVSGALAISPVALGLVNLVLWAIILGGEAWWHFAALRERPAIARAMRLLAPRWKRPVADRELTQQSRRDRQSDGREQVTGWMRVDLAAGQRVAQVHVAFCPPLEQPPTIELRQVAGPAARLKLGQALAYGARFELKLAAPGPASITLEYTATTANVANGHAPQLAAKSAALPAAG